MSSFSERYGFSKARDVLQVDSMDDALRAGLWNVLETMVWGGWGEHKLRDGEEGRRIWVLIWQHFFKEPVDEVPRSSFSEASAGCSSRARSDAFEPGTSSTRLPGRSTRSWELATGRA